MSRNDTPSLTVDVPNTRGPNRRGWHIDKTISISDLVAVVMIAVPAFIWASTTESRIAVMGEKIAVMQQQRSEDVQANTLKLSDLQLQLRSMDSRVTDRLEKIADRVGAQK